MQLYTDPPPGGFPTPGGGRLSHGFPCAFCWERSVIAGRRLEGEGAGASASDHLHERVAVLFEVGEASVGEGAGDFAVAEDGVAGGAADEVAGEPGGAEGEGAAGREDDQVAAGFEDAGHVVQGGPGVVEEVEGAEAADGVEGLVAEGE